MKNQISFRFQEFIADNLEKTTEECLRVGCFLFATLTLNKTTSLHILYDELLYGWCVEEDGIIRTVVSATGIGEYQIGQGLAEIAKLGFFKISLDKKLRQATVELKGF